MKYTQILIFISLYFSCSCQSDFNKDSSIEKTSFKAVGFNEQIWEGIDNDILNGNYGLLNSVLIIHDNKLILENYYNGWTRNQLHDLQSSTKSVVSLLIGIALDKGYIKSINQKMLDFFPQYKFNYSDSLKSLITLENMLTMSTGLKWDENTIEYENEGNSLTDMYRFRDDWIQYILEQPMTDIPGTKFNYNSGISILLAAILQNSTKLSVNDFSGRYLFNPLEINNYKWNDHLGLTTCVYLRSIDFAKIGLLYLNNGKWNGKQIVSEKWLNESSKPKFKVEYKTNFGYHWWSIDSMFDFKPIIHSSGNGWQYLYILKEFNTIIILNGKNYSPEGLKTTFSPNELLFGILACNPLFNEKVLEIYKREIQKPTENVFETIVLSYILNLQGEYQKTINYLNKYGDKYADNFMYNYFMGEAFYKTGDIQSSKGCLRECIKLNNDKKYPDSGYCKKATDFLIEINKNGM